jgi:hypothetical protein
VNCTSGKRAPLTAVTNVRDVGPGLQSGAGPFSPSLPGELAFDGVVPARKLRQSARATCQCAGIDPHAKTAPALGGIVPSKPENLENPLGCPERYRAQRLARSGESRDLSGKPPENVDRAVGCCVRK